MIERDYYLNQLRLLKDQKVIKVITGIRRSGKSTLLQLFREDLARQGVKKRQIQAFNFEEEKNVDLRDWRKLHQRIESKLVPDQPNYIFLDEIQKVEHFEEAVNSLFVKENVDLYITGSNAFLLSGELATFLTGRYVSIHMLPFSFAEYREAFPEEDNEYRLFTQYISSSSFPETIALSQVDQKLAQNYLRDLYNTIINNDIATRYRIRNRAELERVFRYTLSNIGSPTSARNIANVLSGRSMGASNDFGDSLLESTSTQTGGSLPAPTSSQTTHQTVLKYLDYLTQSYLIYPVSRYDVRGKKLLTTSDKFYTVDLGLRQLLLPSILESDMGHRLENIVYLELKKRNEGEIMVGKAGESEVDFIVQKPSGERVYYQVAYHTVEPSTLERELAPFRRISDNYPKFLLTLDLVPEEYAGVKKLNLIDWLLEK